ncbi:hypothetical protein ACHAWF_018197 [Thalassiosira exigua]
MGRVSRYKKVKSIDPFAKNGSWKSDVGDCATLRRTKRKSKTALKLKEQKLNKLRRRGRGKGGDDGNGGRRRGGGCNGWGDDDGYDLPPEGGDEFDMSDLTGSVRKLPAPRSNPLMDATATSHAVVRASRGTVAAAIGGGDAKASKKRKNGASRDVGKSGSGGAPAITAQTPTREIIAACSDPRRAAANDRSSSSNSEPSKQEKRKAYMAEKKRAKKRKRGGFDDGEDDDYDAKQRALQSLHGQSQSKSETSKTEKGPKKHLVKQENYSDALIARTALDDQVERPPVFTSLPRGAAKLAKHRKAKEAEDRERAREGKDNDDNEDDAKERRIRKERLALEALRERAVKQYAMLRESRRNDAMNLRLVKAKRRG